MQYRQQILDALDKPMSQSDVLDKVSKLSPNMNVLEYGRLVKEFHNLWLDGLIGMFSQWDMFEKKSCSGIV